MALAPRQAIAGVSYRADDADSPMRLHAGGLPRVRATAEAVWAAKPTTVVRSWGDDARLLESLERRGVKVVSLDQADDFPAIEANIRKVALALDAQPEGVRLVGRMRRKLEAAHGAGGGRRALYLTPSGYTAGSGTLVSAILEAAGLVNAAGGSAWKPISAERLVINPPAFAVLGFFDALNRDRWSPGRSPVVGRTLQGRVLVSLPASQLGCPGWFSADAAAAIADAAR